ncbi:hypothetical protein Pmar_PMAR013506 [Perkinsus marinus ATCC 50983]|uniref:CCHC-type domain-containing protein n=1 Tax=Perkinsus marinus (strain ATCC 50983 / TXsc) TaxID=423536 RepID=C5LSE9_PERM5|nr:hypothetical protein Pmar_PMAR013506 [Perkinsus marinus ATCC 50983]EER00345.1 hypothetical protein Pmar_PMAR013506 [Perkinsus marinus ATCC 50983]|eukprot:XP_002767627.1 hypothetical protein Pmar_PMAR013506 [Perkinsus marinus ATCC 50983]
MVLAQEDLDAIRELLKAEAPEDYTLSKSVFDTANPTHWDQVIQAIDKRWNTMQSMTEGFTNVQQFRQWLTQKGQEFARGLRATGEDLEGCSISPTSWGAIQENQSLRGMEPSQRAMAKTINSMAEVAKSMAKSNEWMAKEVTKSLAAVSRPAPTTTTRRPLAEVVCYTCNKKGHLASRCPMKDAKESTA